MIQIDPNAFFLKDTHLAGWLSDGRLHRPVSIETKDEHPAVCPFKRHSREIQAKSRQGCPATR